MSRVFIVVCLGGMMLSWPGQDLWGQFATNYDSAGRNEGSRDAWSALVRGGGQALEKKQFDRALEFFDAALASNPKKEALAEIWVLRGDAHAGKKETGKARRDYERALSYLTKEGKDHYSRARIYKLLKNYRAAAVELGKATEAEPKDAEAWNSLAWMKATAPAAEARNGRDAIRAATRACELTNWRNAGYLDTLAAAQAEAGDFEAAIKYQTQALGTRFLSREDRKTFEEHLARFRQRKPIRESGGE